MTNNATDQRILSVDILRGLVIVIMALDHTRDFFHLSNINPTDPATTHGVLFFTRWITHFCAPAFVFLSGVSAFLHAERAGLTKNQLAKFLALRGFWLIVVEIVIINFAWQFAYGFIFIQVIWAIGVSMIVLAGLIYLPMPIIVAFGVALIVGHNLFDGVSSSEMENFGWLWKVLHERAWIGFPEGAWTSGVFVTYPLLPWPGVMALGFAAGQLFRLAPPARDRWLIRIGLWVTAAFIALRLVNIYGDPSPWETQARGAFFTLLSFLNTTKYPASLLFLLMTLGPALTLMPLMEKWKGPIGNFFTVYGRVPFFFYVLHFFLIHILAVVFFGVTAGAWTYDVYTSATYPDVNPSLLRVYIATAVVVGALYFPCQWFGAFKKRHKDWRWLSYL